jgi:Ca2+-binding EF-hand superfamily protein
MVARAWTFGMKNIAIAAACLAVSLTLRESVAQPASGIPPNTYLFQHLPGGMTLDRYLQTLRQNFKQLDADGNGVLDAADIEIHEKMSKASSATSMAMRIMMADLDGDGAVTEDEMRRKLQFDRRLITSLPATSIDQEVRKFMEADADHDGRITWQEAVAWFRKQANPSMTFGMAAVLKPVLALASPGKSSITVAEMEEAATAYFRKVDTDNNGTVSLDELEAERTRVNQANLETTRQRQAEASLVNCNIPKASDAAKVVLLSAYETESLSTVALGSQDEVTGVGNVVAEPGPGPLYIVIATYQPTIWRFYGATERIERVVLMSTQPSPGKPTPNATPRAGVVGIPAERVSFPHASNCLNYFTTAPSTQSAQAAGTVRTAVGKSPDVVVAKYSVVAFNAPSGRIESLKNGGGGGLIIVQNGQHFAVENGKVRAVETVQNPDSELDRYHPGGVVTIDPKTVVASATVESYDVLPQEAGLSQLLKSGVLSRNGSREFLINKEMRFPGGLTGAHSVNFLLRRGVPKPSGHPGHSTVVSEDTGEKLTFERAQ